MNTFLICVVYVFAFICRGMASPVANPTDQDVGVPTPYSLTLFVYAHPYQDHFQFNNWIDIAMDGGHWGARPGSQKSGSFQYSTMFTFKNVQLNYLNTHLIRVRRNNGILGDDTVLAKFNCTFLSSNHDGILVKYDDHNQHRQLKVDVREFQRRTSSYTYQATMYC